MQVQPRQAAFAEPIESQIGCKPWGFWLSIAWVAVADDVLRPLVDAGVNHIPVSEAIGHSGYWHALVLLVSWAVPLAVLTIAVRLARCPIAPYFAWVRFHARYLVIGLIILAIFLIAGRALNYAASGDLGYPVAQTRAEVAKGMPLWWTVLRWYPGFFYAPFVEETMFRGFLWQGIIRTRLGNVGTLLITSFLFACIHYRYFIHDGGFDPGAFLSPFLSGVLFGWVRWKTASTFASMIVHSISNIELNVGAAILA
jgi:hypothetical protein